MTREQMLTTALEIFNKPIANFASEQGDIDGMLEYLDGAIGELLDEQEKKLISDHRDYDQGQPLERDQCHWREYS